MPRSRAKGIAPSRHFFQTWSTLKPALHEHPLLVRFDAFAHELETQRLPEPADFGSHSGLPEAGPRRALRALERFLESKALRYASASGVPADDATSLLSQPLSFGTISARSVVSAARRRCDDPLLNSEERFSLRWFLRSLARRDFFLQLAWFYPHTDDAPLQEKMRDFPFAHSHAHLEAWLNGRTGFPIVDAGMRQLRETGWMASAGAGDRRVIFVLRSGCGLARRPRMLGSFAGRKRSGARHRKLAMECRRRSRYGGLSAYLQSAAPAASMRPGGDVRTPVGPRAFSGTGNAMAGRPQRFTAATLRFDRGRWLSASHRRSRPRGSSVSGPLSSACAGVN